MAAPSRGATAMTSGAPNSRSRRRADARRLRFRAHRSGIPRPDGTQRDLDQPAREDRRGVADAVVVGAGPNGLVAANLLADRGWDVVVLEEAAEPGGAVRSAELLEPGFPPDLFSAFYPFAAVSPHIRGLELERWGLRWLTSSIAVAHPATDG